MQERSKNKQLAINMAATFVTFIVAFGVNFFLTPYIVGSLGTAAYGFVGLSNNIISYTGLITIALNSMAGRFITIKYTQGDYKEANKYFASVFYSNLALSALILLSMCGCLLYLEHIFEIPPELLFDVKVLFSILVVNSIIGLMTNIYAISTFVKNRLELSSIRSIIGDLIRATILFSLFGLFTPHLWYLGCAGIVVSIYIAFTNYRFTSILTPELKLSRSNWDFSKVKELILSGSWNVLSKLNDILGQGLDLIVANLLIGPVAMGFFSISKIVPSFVYSFFSQAGSVFAPSLTQDYANSDIAAIRSTLFQSIRIMGFVATIPAVCLYTFGEEFYTLWLPSQNAYELYVLTILGTLGSIFSMPLEALWNIFTVTNKIKYSASFMVVYNLLSFLTILVVMPFVDGMFFKLCVFSVIRFFFSFAKNFLFLPMFGAKCLNLPLSTFYPAIAKSLLAFILAFLTALAMNYFVEINSWIMLICMCSLTLVACVVVNSLIILTPHDRSIIKEKIIRK